MISRWQLTKGSFIDRFPKLRFPADVPMLLTGADYLPKSAASV
jgi:hypothetical protein